MLTYLLTTYLLTVWLINASVVFSGITLHQAGSVKDGSPFSGTDALNWTSDPGHATQPGRPSVGWRDGCWQSLFIGKKRRVLRRCTVCIPWSYIVFVACLNICTATCVARLNHNLVYVEFPTLAQKASVLWASGIAFFCFFDDVTYWKTWTASVILCLRWYIVYPCINEANHGNTIGAAAADADAVIFIPFDVDLIPHKYSYSRSGHVTVRRWSSFPVHYCRRVLYGCLFADSWLRLSVCPSVCLSVIVLVCTAKHRLPVRKSTRGPWIKKQRNLKNPDVKIWSKLIHQNLSSNPVDGQTSNNKIFWLRYSWRIY